MLRRLRPPAALCGRLRCASSGKGPDGAAGVMDDLHRPTSQTWARLLAGVFAGCFVMGTAHKILDPIDPVCILSASAGAFGYVAVVGSSFPVGYYLGVAVPFGLALPYTWFAHKHE